MSQLPPNDRPGLGEAFADVVAVAVIGMFILKFLPLATGVLLLVGLVSCVF